MFKHRPGEGVYARGTAFWTLAGFAFLAGRRFFLFAQRWQSSRKVLAEQIPVIGVPLTPGFLMGIGVVAIALFGVWKLVNAPKIADLLIDTELEMKKVTWPSFDESRKAAMVVVLCVAVMVLFLTISDVALERIFFSWIYGGAPDGR